MIRDLAGHDPERYAAIMKWPLAEALGAYEARLKNDARRDYGLEVTVWATLAAQGASKSKKAPELPEILKG